MASKITFIGAGNMASAIIGGLIESGVSPSDITATAPNDSELAPLKARLGIHTHTDNSAAVSGADVVVLAVKPQIMRSVCEALRDSVQQQAPLVMSIAAGLDAGTIDQWLGGGNALVRCMPNTPSLVGIGASGLYANAAVSDAQRTLATQLMEAVGIVEWVDEERLLDAVTAVSGSAPAYFFLMFEAMEEAAVKLGLPADTARRLAIQTALGASTMAQRSDKDPATLKQNVMSPGGTTERAIHHMEEANLRTIIADAMNACAERADAMSKELSGNA
ncbi:MULTISPECIES: pyrroline-5-carboxylate reductase [unclassified Halomonas]|uniref:pyrroline-5-carboxylate reductase n=1 Tax=unclassified Halomonas TaxID=2609666 RepID=UPI001EF61863|nr:MULTISPECIES: pyrroline-5-carboxylate reductase [unclassified Halomonas]MCG7577576.1 pyrroline-5-carboxylate reductase [Halomonas sp. MMH1-48]MCG7604553.1 pyrroline-5-carboxylate reductase [Halomonas sp. MM17-34]MCG7613775.1 pyrroline-5-carboxylate reductase [Halomonas sp. MM17-29]MCG7620576.1 pyrroline-5-carboxylate reductase [Halomonas sp. DSH1-27]